MAEPADHRGHDHEEHHDQAVTGDEDVEGMGITEDLQAGIHQFGAHHHGKECADEARANGENKVHRADVLVVRGIDKPPPAGGVALVGCMRAVRCAVIVCTCHGALLVLYQRPAATRVGASTEANFVLASVTHMSKAASLTTSTVMSMKSWRAPHNSEHSP